MPDTLRALLAEVGRVYAPFLLANAAALERGAEQVECAIDGRPWVQRPFPYQGKCLRWLREGYAALAAGDRARRRRAARRHRLRSAFPLRTADTVTPRSAREIDMHVANQVYPTFEQLMSLAQDPTPGPIAMVNLLKFRDRAQYHDGRRDDISGREAYMRYIVEMAPIVEAAGGKFLFSGAVGSLVIGEVEELWDAVGIAQYPSRAEFHRIATSPEVQAIGVHREAGLAGQLLILTTDLLPPPLR